MSHDVETMVSVREVPWHGLGTIVADKMTAKEALVAAGLDWAVDVEPVYVKGGQPDGAYQTHNGDLYVAVPDKFAVVRDVDRFVMEIVGGRYTPVQNWRSFEFFDTLVESDEAKYETAGSLDHGRRVFISAFVPREIKIGGVDAIDLYLVLANSHDGSLAFTAAVTPVRPVCKNTLNLALGSQCRQMWKLRHTDSIDGKVQEAREALTLTFDYADEFERRMNLLIDDEFTKVEFERMVRDVFPGEANKQGRFTDEQYALIGVFESSPTIDDSFRYTKWGALNSVREYDDWGRTIRSTKGKSEAEQRTERAWFGPNVTRANKTLAYLEN